MKFKKILPPSGKRRIEIVLQAEFIDDEEAHQELVLAIGKKMVGMKLFDPDNTQK
jgi:hypothetical protein